MRRDSQGRIHFKVVFYGPTFAGKTTILRRITELLKEAAEKKGKDIEVGEMISFEDRTGRTIKYDYVPVRIKSLIYEVYTTPGQRRHKFQRMMVLKDADAIIFVADSENTPERREENLYSRNELKHFLGSKLFTEIPVIVVANKRDLPNKISIAELRKLLGLPPNVPIFETIAKPDSPQRTDERIKAVFKTAVREAVLRKILKLSPKLGSRRKKE